VANHRCLFLQLQQLSARYRERAAIFPEAAVTIAGEHRQWWHLGDSRRFVESSFCPTFGTAVLFRAKGLPGCLGVPVGSFSDPSFAWPSKLF
jgi:hypothetical protein